MRVAAYGHAYTDKHRAHFSAFVLWSSYAVGYGAATGGVVGVL